ncbi:MAG: PrsW family intramembrane metalloprotease [Chloroflexota bacterium]
MTAAFGPPPSSANQRRRPTPRWGVQTGLVQPRQPAFWLFVVAMVLGGLYFLLTQLIEIVISPAGWALSWLLLLLYIVPVFLVVRWLDLYEREPRSLLIGAFLWGAIVAEMFSGLGNDAWGVVITRLFGPEFASHWSAALTAPVIEEIYKYLGIAVLFLIARAEFDDLIDGFVYGALIGLGFAVAEDVSYFIFVFGGDVPSVIQGFWVRVVGSGLYSHVTFTGIAGIGFAYFVTRRLDQPLMRRLLVAGALLLLAIVAHFVWNSPFLRDLDIILYGAFKGLPFLIGLIILLYLARRREHSALSEILAGEVGQPGLVAPEMEALLDRGSRRAASQRIRVAGGREAERLLKQLQREQLKLALVASSVDSTDDAQLVQQRAVNESLRFRLWQMPGVAAALGVAPEAAEATLRAVSAFTPDRLVGAQGAWAWARPDQSERRRVGLAPGLPLDVVEERPEGWVLVRSQSGWYGWTGAPYLTGFTGTT